MNQDDRDEIERVLSRISREAWNEHLSSEDGEPLGRRLRAVNAAIRSAGHAARGAPARPIAEVIDLLGHRLMSDTATGTWLREMVLREMSPGKWSKLAEDYNDYAGERAERLHGNMTQHGAGSRVLASYWHQGSYWSRQFCKHTGLPEVLARRRTGSLLDEEEIVPVEAMPDLHDFQKEMYTSLKRFIRNGVGKAALLSLPTGAGKTRVTVEAVCDALTESLDSSRPRDIVLWISQSEELLQQAWECFREVWQSVPRRSNGVRVSVPLRLVRLWGGRSADTIEYPDGPTILIAGVQQLRSWTERGDFYETFPYQRIACTIVDEAHALITQQYREVLIALRCRAQREWRMLSQSSPVIGLTATPWRSDSSETASLREFFGNHLMRPDSLGSRPIAALQSRGILARVRPEKLEIVGTPPMTAAQRSRFEQYHDLPLDYVRQLGEEESRNASILERLMALPASSRVLVFACSVEHAEILTMALNRLRGERCAALVTGETPRAERAAIIDRFRRGRELQFLCNVGVLTTGFDAPKVDVVCVTRPTTSAILYEQMVGRGLRGPQNGGTASCLVLDVQDDGLPEGIQSYARVMKLWDGG